jgi:site-specific DNA-methyltransferase (adenine-specific)
MKPYNEDGIAIYHGDFREVLPTLDERVMLLFTDPPYGNGNQQEDFAAVKVRTMEDARKAAPEPILNDKPGEWFPLMRALLTLSMPLMFERSAMAVMCAGGGGSPPSFARLAVLMDEVATFAHALVWDKTARGPGLGWRFRRDYEFVMLAHPKGSKLYWSDEDAVTSNILRFTPAPNVMHPTEKPVELAAHLIRLFTQEDDLILDPMCGSGTTLMAAKLLGRRAIGIELDERYAQRAADRLSQKVLFK